MSTPSYFEMAKGTPEARALIDEASVNEELNQKLKTIRTTVEEIRAILFFKGMVAGDIFHQIAYENRFGPDETTLCPRVRRDARFSTPSFSWEKIKRLAVPMTTEPTSPPKKGSGYSWTKTVRRKNTGNYQTMRIVLTSKYLRINKATNRVSSKHFCSEPEWAQVSALAVEDEFCALRTLNSRLSTISKALSAAQNILNTAKKY